MSIESSVHKINHHHINVICFLTPTHQSLLRFDLVVLVAGIHKIIQVNLSITKRKQRETQYNYPNWTMNAARATSIMLVRAVASNPSSKNALKATTGRITASVRGASYLSLDVHNDCIDMAIDCHQGDGTYLLDSMPLTAPVPTSAPKQSLDYLKDIVNEGDVSSVLVSWPPLSSLSSATSSTTGTEPTILSSLDSVMKDSCDNAENVVAMTRPFYMLDGCGRRMASMCLVKDLHHMNNMSTTVPSSSPFSSSFSEPSCQPIGTWLRMYHDDITGFRKSIPLWRC